MNGLDFGTGGGYQNPLINYKTGFKPKKLKELFSLCEHLVYDSPHVFAAIRKYSEYPITDFEYSTLNNKAQERCKGVLERTLKMKSFLIRVGYDYHIYGNTFTSIYFPFVRYLECPSCKHRKNIRYVNYTFNLQKLKFQHTCDSCHKSVESDPIDQKVINPEGINLIRWDPKCMVIDHNQTSGSSEYYYQIPADIKSKIKNGNRNILNTTPLGFLKAVKHNQPFKFEPGQIYHMKSPAPAGFNDEWGLPLVTGSLGPFYHSKILSRANEAIAFEYLNPLRVVFPNPTTGNNDPSYMIAAQRLTSELERSLKKHRQDPNYVMFSPIPLGTSNIGGEGRALMVQQEIEASNSDIIMSMGIPEEFLRGGLSFTGSSVTLRMLENSLAPYVAEIESLVQWITDRVGNYLSWGRVEVTLSDFKLVDDVQQKSLLFSLHEMGVLAPSSLMSTMGFDAKEEREKIIKDRVETLRMENEIFHQEQELRDNISEQARMGSGGPGRYNPNAIQAEAAHVVQELGAMDPQSAQHRLTQLRDSDYVMWAVVAKMWESYRADMRKQEQQQGGMM